MIQFDKEAPGGGIDAYTVIENGKAEIFFTVYLADEGGEEQEWPVNVEITIYDPKGREAARMCLHPGTTELRIPAPQATASCITEALTTRTLIIYPQLWQSVDNPFLYRVRAMVIAGETVADLKEFPYPVCSMHSVSDKGFFLNHKPFCLRAVRCPITKDWRQYLEKDLALLLELGANCICPDRFPKDSLFYEKCLEKGLIIWKLPKENLSIPQLWGGDKPLVSADRLRRQDLFYYYQAGWSSREVLHICSHKKTPRPGTTASAVVYSNQKKAALYVNGILHEFKQSPPEFVFEDIPVIGEHTVVSVQAGECFASVTWSV